MVIVMTLRTRGPDLALSLTSRLSTMLPAHPADLSRSIPDPGFAGPGINPCSSPTPHHVRVRVSANWFADPALASHLECVLGCMTNFQDVLWGQLNMHTGSFPAAWDCSVCQGMWLRPPPFNNKPNKAQVRKGGVFQKHIDDSPCTHGHGSRTTPSETSSACGVRHRQAARMK